MDRLERRADNIARQIEKLMRDFTNYIPSDDMARLEDAIDLLRFL